MQDPKSNGNPPNNIIPGGYILKARKIDKSWISKAPPHVREIWDWLLRNVNYQDRIVGGALIKRGQRLITWDEIIEDLSWMVGYRKMKYKKHHCEIAMNALTKQTMITTAKTTRGTIVTICNYDYYQTPQNYENDYEADTRTTTKTTEYGNDKQELKESKNGKKTDLEFAIPVLPKERKISTSDHSSFIAWYHTKFLETFGIKPLINGKDGAIVKRLLQNYELSKLIDLGEQFFSSDDEFIQKTGYTLGVFSSVLNKLIAGKMKSRDPTGGRYSKGPEEWLRMRQQQRKERGESEDE